MLFLPEISAEFVEVVIVVAMSGLVNSLEQRIEAIHLANAQGIEHFEN